MFPQSEGEGGLLPQRTGGKTDIPIIKNTWGNRMINLNSAEKLKQKFYFCIKYVT
jgi:hypothetical protein